MLLTVQPRPHRGTIFVSGLLLQAFGHYLDKPTVRLLKHYRALPTVDSSDKFELVIL